MTITPIKSFAEQVSRHKDIADRLQNTHAELHVLLCQDLLHCAEHGDTSLCFDIYTKLGGENSASRTATMKTWFVKMSGNQMTAEKGVWKMKKGWTKEKFLLEQAEKEPYWTLGGERKPFEFSLEAILGMFKSVQKKLDRAEDDQVKGSRAELKKFVDNVLNFAEARSRLVPLKDSGALEVAADKILEANADRVPAAVQPTTTVANEATAGSVTEPEAEVVAA